MAGVLKSFRLPLDFYADDVRDIVGTCIERYGEREWKIITLTNEIHGHLGIYSTLGAKMGLYATELLQADSISVLSFAGSQPPISCFNDGLQVSTGASLGHGLIGISDEAEKRAEAVFTCGRKSVRLRLKPQYENAVIADIKKGVALYGNSPEYWLYVRTLALEYWRDWDRKEIFTELSLTL